MHSHRFINTRLWPGRSIKGIRSEGRQPTDKHSRGVIGFFDPQVGAALACEPGLQYAFNK
jgi:hypothetical protein